MVAMSIRIWGRNKPNSTLTVDGGSRPGGRPSTGSPSGVRDWEDGLGYRGSMGVLRAALLLVVLLAAVIAASYLVHRIGRPTFGTITSTVTAVRAVGRS
jgi:hypothetical protein